MQVGPRFNRKIAARAGFYFMKIPLNIEGGEDEDSCRGNGEGGRKVEGK